MTKSIKRAALGITLCFCVLSFGLVYWQFFQSDELLAKPGNLRAIYEEQKIWRGGIFDRNGEILAKSYTPEEAEKLLGKKVQPTVRPPDNQYPPQIRLYPKGDLYTHVVGTYSFIYEKSGLEQSLNKLLLGLGPGESIQSLSQQVVDKSRRGNDVVLTLDSKIQAAAVNSLKDKPGAAVAIEPKTGRILAMASGPTYNPNELDQKFKDIEQKGNQVFVNKALRTYTPGSIMKLVSAGALLRAGIDPFAFYEDTGHDRVEAKGESRDVYDFKKDGHGSINFTGAIANSCNAYFATRTALAGAGQFLDAARRNGFGEQIPLWEMIVSPKSISTSTIKGAGVPGSLNLGELMDSSYGQAQVQVSPLHAAMITAAIANKGQMMRPALVEKVISPKQEIVYQL
ncbi:MAG TPA: penicillin-binding transpeptidase domain-containing protein, partial [Verrucomicrobiae bacterium]|nr:penicillin-binding transpeptidase domain-containing protein [Verrucomicrobiae bacterium]